MSDKLNKLMEIINTALQAPGKSKLTEAQFDVGGFISPNVRHLYNNLGAISTHYLECGTHAGSSLVSAVYGNDNLKSATGIDNFSLFSENQDIAKEFYNNADRHIKGRYTMLEMDYFKNTKKEIPNPIDLYLFDGDHSYEHQYKGITHYAQFFADECIVLVDDGGWKEPNAATFKGLADSGLTVDYYMTLWSGRESDCGDRGFWNGIIVALVSKNKK